MKWLFGMFMSREDARQLSVNLHSLQILHGPRMWGIWKKPKDADWWSSQMGHWCKGWNHLTAKDWSLDSQVGNQQRSQLTSSDLWGLMAKVGAYSSEEDSKLPGRTDQRYNTMARASPGQGIPTNVSMKTKGLALILWGYLSSGKEGADRSLGGGKNCPYSCFNCSKVFTT